MTMKAHEDYVHYPEPPLQGRTRLAYDWIPDKSRRLLDGGCAFGYGTRYFKAKAAETFGVDPNESFITIAQTRYPEIFFQVSGMEQTPFIAEFFDVIILNEVLEHVVDEQKTLNEMCRILAPNGTFIITTPHRGLFSFMDNENFVYHLRTKAAWLYRWLYRAKYGRFPPNQIKPGYEQLHRHYSLRDMILILNNSDFNNRYKIDRVFRSGLLAGVVCGNLYELLCLLFGMKVAGALNKPFNWLANKEYLIPFGALAWNIAIRVKKIR